jgi:DNA polymerase-3 subunit alpha
MRDLVAARDAGGDFASLAEFAARVDPKLLNKMQIENLGRAGAFECLDGNRARVMAGAETILRRAQASAEERDSGQIGLFGAEPGRPEALRLPDVPDWQPLDRLSQEAEAIGFHLSAHPLDAYRQALKRIGVVPSSAIADRASRGGGRVKLAGTVVNSKERTTKTGSRMAWVRVSDTHGSFEVTCFSEVLNRSRELLAEGSAILVTADLRMEGEALRLTATELESLDKVAANAGGGIRVWLDAFSRVKTEHLIVDGIEKTLKRQGYGRGRVIINSKLDDHQTVEISLRERFDIGPRLIQAMRLVPGVAQVEEF